MDGHNKKQNVRHPRPALLLFVFSVCSGIQLALSGNDLSELSVGNFKRIPGYSLLGNVTATHSFADYLTCTFACLNHHRCFSFNFGRISRENLFACELSNSLEAWDPQNVQSRPGFEFFEAVMDPAFVHPCLSSPCQNGGTCTQYKGKYTCKCPLEIGVLPYIDDRCNIQMDRTRASQMNSGVSHCWAGGHGKLNFHEAERLCELLGATLASYQQLYRSWQNGFQTCSYGWLADGTWRLPRQTAHGSCGHGTVGIAGSTRPRDKVGTGTDAYCYKSV